jgi:hypothetical protein
MADSVEIELRPLTDMVTRMYTSDFVKFVTKKHGTLRHFYETSSTTTQCNNTTGHVLSDVTPCWICGFIIPNVNDQYHAFYPECEHVFPIAQAIFFIGLYTNDVKDNAEYVKKLRLEYDWSHRVCNQIKNDSHFIEHRIDHPDGRWGINTDKIKAFLNDILVRGNKYGGGDILLKQQIQKAGMTINTWIDRRTAVIQQRCSDILRTIEPENEDIWILATVSDLSYAYEHSGFVPEVIEPYNPIGVSGQIIVLDQQQTTKVYTTWADFIMKHVRDYTLKYLGERIRRYTPEEKAMRSYKVLSLLDQSLISKVGQHVWTLYNALPNDVNRQARFVEGVQYIISSILLERMNRIFTDVSDPKSPSLKTLGNELRTNVNTIQEIWVTNKLQNILNSLNTLLSTQLKGASRRRR